ncbi:TolC family protein [Terracidiphilus gabretensis]|uniref:TolC family protein n=1 Tax=Terracidiphilus gabretensis TaxID=1577687 RepID=UPI0018D2720A|nr:TolC family protein [Terracidiphilus gabretensis]
MSRTSNSAAKLAAIAVIFAAVRVVPTLRAQVNPSSDSNYSSAANSFYGSVTVQPVTDEELKLSLDDAVRRGLDTNLGLKQAEYSEKNLRGQYNQAVQQFLPTISLVGDAGYHMYNLAALGFGPGLVQKILPILPPGTNIAGLSFITRAEVTEGQLKYEQTLFSGPVIAGYKAAGAGMRAAYFAKMSARGEVVQQVASVYLRAISAASAVENARALEEADRVAFNNAHEAHLAGTAANLDELRARVQYQTEQQARIQAENTFQKDLILLKREIGLDPGQKIVLIDRAPYSELAVQTPEEVRAIAYKNRQDYQNMQNQVQELKAVHQAYRAQRLPTLSFNGYYGVTEVTSIGSHGNFAATGELKFPIFREASLRGNIDASQAQSDSAEAQLSDLRVKIDQQVRTALLDVAANKKLVDVAQSNVELATRALSDETDRVNAGVDDTLPLVDAQASLATAQNNYVESLYQFNISKLILARSAGILEQQYRDYLGR